MNIKNKNPKTDWQVGDDTVVFVPGGQTSHGTVMEIEQDMYTVRTPSMLRHTLPCDELFRSEEEADACAKAFGNRASEYYKSNIHNLKDLLKFALDMPLCTDGQAAKAFKERTQELLGIEL